MSNTTTVANNDKMLGIYVSLHQIRERIKQSDYEPNIFTGYLRSVDVVELAYPKLPVFLNLVYSTPFSSQLDSHLAVCRKIIDGGNLRRIASSQIPAAVSYLKNSSSTYGDFIESQRLFA